MSVERVAGSPWNQWPDVHGIGGRMAVESAVSEPKFAFHSLYQVTQLYKIEARLLSIQDTMAIDNTLCSLRRVCLNTHLGAYLSVQRSGV
jgi:hypothetical protein